MACLTLAVLVFGVMIAIATLGAAAPEAAVQGAGGRHPAAACRWELVEISAVAGWRGVLESWPAQASAPLVLLDQCWGETWLAARGPSGLEWRDVARR